jgi:ferredoxin
MAITKVWIDETNDECSMCGACEAVCDAVFEVPEKAAIKAGADFAAHEAEIKEAADGCPVGVIKWE